MMRKVLALFLVLSSVGFAAESKLDYPNRPKLIVTLVIDQFRADYLTRFKSRFLPAFGKNGEVGGFRYLMDEGAYYPYAQYDILHSMTGPGHATILSGAYPYQAGIPVNYWFDFNKNEKVYCAEDPAFHTIGLKDKAHLGTSPRNLNATTVGDELKNAGLPSRVISMALKDRAAILMGGRRADLALWFDGKLFQWTSSNYYLADGKFPGWLEKLNTEVQGFKGKKYVWTLAGTPTGYSQADAIAFHKYPPPVGKAFPHETVYGSRESVAMPFGLDLMETAAERLVENFELGRGKGTDLLAASFSNHDYMAHAYGPLSLEMEEMTVAEDRVIAKFLNFLRKRMPGGLKDVVIVLTADHGAPLPPEWLKEHKMDAGRINEKKIAEAITQRLNDKFGKPQKGEWVSFFYDFNFYLNHPALKEKDLDPATVHREAKAVVAAVEGVAYVVTGAEYAARMHPPGQHERQTMKTYYPGRSGDLVLIPKPYWVSDDDDLTPHMTGYNFDRTVPLILAGKDVKPGVYSKMVEVVDLAPTLTFLGGVTMPSLSEGRVLSEALRYAH